MSTLRARLQQRRRRRDSSNYDEVLQLAMHGLVMSYNGRKEKGFLMAEVAERLKMKKRDILVSTTTLCPGQEVLFDLVSRAGVLFAINVRLDEEEEKEEERSSSKAVWSAANSGYDIELFVCDVPEEFICSVCHGVMYQPLQTPCEHIFCGACAHEAISRRRLCPVDRRPVTEAELRPMHRVLQSLHEGLHMRCRYAGAGCAKVMRLGEEFTHAADCPFKTSETNA